MVIDYFEGSEITSIVLMYSSVAAVHRNTLHIFTKVCPSLSVSSIAWK